VNLPFPGKTVEGICTAGVWLVAVAPWEVIGSADLIQVPSFRRSVVLRGVPGYFPSDARGSLQCYRGNESWD
jgi:hypothetical protein